jgi:hypothetical protein
MIVAAFLSVAAPVSSTVQSPVMTVEERIIPSAIPAILWKCQTASADRTPLSVSGRFPAISADKQKDGRAYGLSTKMEGTGRDDFTGSFPAVLTFNDLMGMTQYSIMIPQPNRQEAKYVLNFEFFRGAHDGFVNVLRFDAKTGIRTAFATGLCTTQVDV